MAVWCCCFTIYPENYVKVDYLLLINLQKNQSKSDLLPWLTGVKQDRHNKKEVSVTNKKKHHFFSPIKLESKKGDAKYVICFECTIF